MLHKIREAMEKRDNHYQLTEFIEIDEGFFETIDKEIVKDDDKKRGEKLFDRIIIACISNS